MNMERNFRLKSRHGNLLQKVFPPRSTATESLEVRTRCLGRREGRAYRRGTARTVRERRERRNLLSRKFGHEAGGSKSSIRTENTHRADATATLLIGILIGAVICAVLFAIVKLLG